MEDRGLNFCFEGISSKSIKFEKERISKNTLRNM